MRELKIFNQTPGRPLAIDQIFIDRIRQVVDDTNISFLYEMLFKNADSIADNQLYQLAFMAIALSYIKDTPGFERHLLEYRNDLQSAYFVTVVAFLMKTHGFKIELEPEIEKDSKKPDIIGSHEVFLDYAPIYIECKRPNSDTHKYESEVSSIFNGIKDVIDNTYGLACFYERSLSNDEISFIKSSIFETLEKEKNIFENRILFEDSKLGVKIVVSGFGDYVKTGKIKIFNLPNFSEKKEYSDAIAINEYGKNIIFYKKGNPGTIEGLLRSSRHKVPSGLPYIVCIDFSDSRFDISYYKEYFEKHFNEKRIDKNISAMMLITHGITLEGTYRYTVNPIINKNAIVPIQNAQLFLLPNLAYDIFKYFHR